MAQLHQALAGNTAALERVLGGQAALLEKYASSDLNGALRSLSEAVKNQLSEGRTPPRPPRRRRGPACCPAPGRSGIFSRILGRDRD